MTPDEIIELSNIIGYPVFIRLCMGVLQHKNYSITRWCSSNNN